MNIQSVGTHNFQNVNHGLGNTKVNDSLNPQNKIFSLEMPKKEKVEETKENLERMMEDINEIKNQIDFDLTVENVMQYKKVVKAFLQYYVDNALQTKDVIYRNGRHNEKLTIVKKIDEGIGELDDAMTLLDTRRGHLDMLKKIGEINGMIVNLKL